MSVVAEIGEVASAFGGQQVFLPDAGVWGVEVRHCGRSIVAHQAPDHPWSPSWVFIDPPPSWHAHYYRHGDEPLARLCWCMPFQWDASFPLLVAVGSAIRFLNEEVR